MNEDTLNLQVSWNWLPKQWKFFQFEAEGRVSKEALLGAWGSGKTTGAARKFLKRCLQNPWRSEYGQDQPKAVIMAPTFKILSEATIPKFEAACPKDLVMKKRGFPSPYIELANGMKILLSSAEGSLEGLDLCVFWIDEISHPIFTASPEKFVNYMARLRDPLSTKMSMIASGLPMAGWVREQFDQDENDKNSKTILCGIDDNPFIHKDTRDQMLSACPAGWEGVLLRGDWGMPIGATFPMFDSSTHLSNQEIDPNKSVHLGIDIGNHGSVIVAQMVPFERKNIIGQKEQQMGLYIVDQILTEFESLDHALIRFRTETRWRVDPGHSKICVDPTIRRDELQSIYKHFPGVHVVKRERTEDFYEVNNGLRHLQSCLRDALGNAKIKIHKRLERQKFGVVEALQMARGNPQTGVLYIKDDSRDHVVCSTRYLVCELLAPIERVKPVRVN